MNFIPHLDKILETPASSLSMALPFSIYFKRNKVVEASALPASVDIEGAGSANIESRCDQLDAEDAGRRFLSETFDISLHSFVLDSVVEKEWPDEGLGCPVEGQSYDQVSTQGYVMIFEQNNIKYEVHTDTKGLQVVICGS